ncbi:Fe-S-containing hydro-lyase [bacterium]|nr:Fe-S-containing hydro-lyase [bacterium]
MSKEIYLKTPLKTDELVSLNIGDKVFITGTLYTARDAVHKKLFTLLEKKEPLPFSLAGQIIYYVGPSPAKPGDPIGSAGPTTSYRMDKYTPALLDLGLKAMIGKGVRSKEVKEAVIRNKAVYFIAVGGAGALLAQTIKTSKVIAYDELGAEALREITVENFPCFVGLDTKGNDLYEQGIATYQIHEETI